METMVTIIVGRLVQGSFGALLIPQGISIITASFSREQLPRATSAFGPALGLSAVLGPIVGGFIISANLAGLGWRPVFLINIVLGPGGPGGGLLRLLPRDRAGLERCGSMSRLGPARPLTMLGLFFGLIQGSADGWTALPIAAMAAGAGLLRGLRRPSAVRGRPLIKPTLLANKGFTSGLILALAFFAAVTGITYLISLFFQLVLHYSAAKAALSLAPSAFGSITASIVGRPLLERLGRTLVAGGLAVTLAGALGLWLTVHEDGTGVTGYLTIPSVFVLGLGMGTFITSCTRSPSATSPPTRPAAQAVPSAPSSSSPPRSAPPSSPASTSTSAPPTAASRR